MGVSYGASSIELYRIAAAFRRRPMRSSGRAALVEGNGLRGHSKVTPSPGTMGDLGS
jgi:hypothetical protein